KTSTYDTPIRLSGRSRGGPIFFARWGRVEKLFCRCSSTGGTRLPGTTRTTIDSSGEKTRCEEDRTSSPSRGRCGKRWLSVSVSHGSIRTDDPSLKVTARPPRVEDDRVLGRYLLQGRFEGFPRHA